MRKRNGRKELLPESRFEDIRAVIQEVMKEEGDRMTFPDTEKETVTDILKSCFSRAGKEGRTEKKGGIRLIYHIFPDGIRILPEDRRESYLADYESLAEVAVAMIAAGELEALYKHPDEDL